MNANQETMTLQSTVTDVYRTIQVDRTHALHLSVPAIGFVSRRNLKGEARREGERGNSRKRTANDCELA